MKACGNGLLRNTLVSEHSLSTPLDYNIPFGRISYDGHIYQRNQTITEIGSRLLKKLIDERRCVCLLLPCQHPIPYIKAAKKPSVIISIIIIIIIT